MFVRLLGALFVVATILALGLYWAECAFAKPPLPVAKLPCAEKLIPAALGFVILLRAKKIAAWLSDQFDG